MEQAAASEKQKEHLYDDFHMCRNYMTESGEALFVSITCKERVFYCVQCCVIFGFGSFLAEIFGFRIKLSSFSVHRNNEVVF